MLKEMEGIQHKTVSTNGLNIHIAEKGEGPLVLFLHGFPQLWYTWRHQILYFADHGYRAVAPDLRGCGDTTGAPVNDHTKFTIHHLVGDLIGLLDAIANEGEQVFVVGHNWGAIIAWNLCMFRPDRVKALVTLSVPFVQRNPNADLVETLRAKFGEDHYMTRFQEPGELEAEVAEMGIPAFLKKVLTYREPEPLYLSKGKGFRHSPGDTPAATLPPWLSEEDFEYYATKLQHTGITGPVNCYRALHLNWELTAAWAGGKVRVPSKYIVGDLDLAYKQFGKEYIVGDGFKKDVPFLEEVVVIEGVGHFINEEKPDEISNHIIEFLRKF